MPGTFDYAKVQGIAGKVMKQFKQGAVQLIVETPGNGPASNPGAPSRVTYTLDATVQGVPSKFIDSGLANKGDLLVTSAVHATAPEPKAGMIVVVDGAEYRIVEPMHVPPSGTRVVWKFTARR